MAGFDCNRTIARCLMPRSVDPTTINEYRISQIHEWRGLRCCRKCLNCRGGGFQCLFHKRWEIFAPSNIGEKGGSRAVTRKLDTFKSLLVQVSPWLIFLPNPPCARAIRLMFPISNIILTLALFYPIQRLLLNLLPPLITQSPIVQNPQPR